MHERSLGALCVARAGRKECPELAEILQSWDGEFSVLVRKRVGTAMSNASPSAAVSQTTRSLSSGSTTSRRA